MKSTGTGGTRMPVAVAAAVLMLASRGASGQEAPTAAAEAGAAPAEVAPAEGTTGDSPAPTAETPPPAAETPPPAAGTPVTGTVPPDATMQPAPAVAPAPAAPAPAPALEPPVQEPLPPQGPRKLMLLLGPGFGLSFFYPTEVNDYLEYWVDRIPYAETSEGSTTAMVLALQPKLAITFAPIEYVQIQLVGEIGWAPKVMAVIGGDSESFHFTRFSVGGTVAGHLPLRNGKSSISLGAGALFNVLKFRSLQEVAPGYRGVFGFRFYTRRAFTPEIFVEFNWIKADTGRDPTESIPGEIGNLSYISGTIGGNFYFKVVEKR